MLFLRRCSIGGFRFHSTVTSMSRLIFMMIKELQTVYFNIAEKQRAIRL